MKTAKEIWIEQVAEYEREKRDLASMPFTTKPTDAEYYRFQMRQLEQEHHALLEELSLDEIRTYLSLVNTCFCCRNTALYGAPLIHDEPCWRVVQDRHGGSYSIPTDLLVKAIVAKESAALRDAIQDIQVTKSANKRTRL